PDTFPVCGMKVFLNADGYMQIQEAEGRTLLSVASGPPSNIGEGMNEGEGMKEGMNARVRILLFSQAVGYN
ncbi:hypothetical protein, partial [Salmonella enterica]|uniref:hypothetical protein n=1 Tax=Salmonella enterica TaxID=28901 RepID=UPI0009CF359D